MAKFQDSTSLLPTSSGRPPFFILIAALVSLVALPGAHARRWEDVIAVSIYAQSHVDIPRIQFAIEDNPLNVAPTVILLSESQPPSDEPSSVPSYYNQEDDDEDEPVQDPPKLDCSQGEAAFKLNMYDSWGDGWGETTISIRQMGRLEGAPTVALSQDVALHDFTTTTTSTSIQKRSIDPRSSWQHRGLEDYVLIGGLKKGDFDSQHVCLSQSACYAVALQGGMWQEEAKWEIIPVDAETGTSAASQNAIAKGRGLSNCTFYVTEDPVDQPNCPFTCRPPPPEPEEEEVDEAAEEEVDEEGEEADQPEVETTNKQGEDVTKNGNTLQTNITSQPTPAQTEPSSAPSDAPSLVPTL